MVSLVSTSKLGSTLSLVAQMITGATSVVSAYADLGKFEHFGALVSVADLTGAGVTKVEIVAADNTSGTNLTVIKDTGVIAADAVNDQVFLECIAEELAQLASANSTNLRYVAVRITLANAADIASLTRILGSPSYAVDGLTPATTIA